MKKGRKKVSLIILGIAVLLVVILVILCSIPNSTSLIEKFKDLIVTVVGGLLVSLLVWLIIPEGKKDGATSDANSEDTEEQSAEDKNAANTSESKQQWEKIVLIFILTMVAFVIIRPIDWGWAKSTPEPTITTEMTSTPMPTEAPSPSPTVQPTPTPHPTATPSSSEMVNWSNKGYNDAQKLKDSRTTEALDKYTIAHRNSGKIRQIDIAATTSQSEYSPYPYQSTIYYYTADGDLCFILLHNAGTKNDDLRFYVYDNTVIQFKDVDGTTSCSAPDEYSDICERGMNVYYTACDALGIKYN